MKNVINKSTVYFAFGLVLVGGLLGACSAGGAAQNSRNMGQSGNANVVATTVHVTTSEMEFNFDQIPTKAGSITFVVINNGKIEHNFVLQANGRDYATKMLPPGASETITADLAPGTYNFVCGVFGHNFAGMQGSFTLS